MWTPFPSIRPEGLEVTTADEHITFSGTYPEGESTDESTQSDKPEDSDMWNTFAINESNRVRPEDGDIEEVVVERMPVDYQRR